MEQQQSPIIDLLPTGGFRVTQNGVSGEGATIPAALAALSANLATRYDAEKGDDSLAAQTATRQTDILANDRAILGNQLQGNIVLALGLGLI